MNVGRVTVNKLVVGNIIIENGRIYDATGSITLASSNGYNIKIITPVAPGGVITRQLLEDGYIINSVSVQTVMNKTYDMSMIYFRYGNKRLYFNVSGSSAITYTIPTAGGQLVFTSTLQTFTNKSISSVSSPSTVLRPTGIITSNTNVIILPDILPVVGRALAATSASTVAWTQITHNALVHKGTNDHNTIDNIFGLYFITGDMPVYNGSAHTVLPIGVYGQYMIASTTSTNGIYWDYISAQVMAVSAITAGLAVSSTNVGGILALNEASNTMSYFTFRKDSAESPAIGVGASLEVVRVSTLEYDIPLRITRYNADDGMWMRGYTARYGGVFNLIIKISSNTWYCFTRNTFNPAYYTNYFQKVVSTYARLVASVVVTRSYSVSDPNYPGVVVPVSSFIGIIPCGINVYITVSLQNTVYLYVTGYTTATGKYRFANYTVTGTTSFPRPTGSAYNKRIAMSIITPTVAWLMEFYDDGAKEGVLYYINPSIISTSAVLNYMGTPFTDTLVTIIDITHSMIYPIWNGTLWTGMLATYDTSYNIRFHIGTTTTGSSVTTTTLYAESSTLGIKSIGIGICNGKPCVFSYTSVNSSVKYMVANDAAGTSWPGTYSTFAATDSGTLRFTACDSTYNSNTDMYIISTSSTGVISIYGTSIAYNTMFYKLYTFDTGTLNSKATWITTPIIYKNVFIFSGCQITNPGIPYLCVYNLKSNRIRVDYDPLRLGPDATRTDTSAVSYLFRYDTRLTLYAHGHAWAGGHSSNSIDLV